MHNPDLTVNVVDLNADRIAAWNSPHLPIHEAGLPKIVRIARDGTNDATALLPSVGKSVKLASRKPNLCFTTDVKRCIGEADIVLICVNTPTKTYGLGAGYTADLSALEGASETVAKYAKNGAVIVEKSTVPTGTARMIKEIVSFSLPDELGGMVACLASKCHALAQPRGAISRNCSPHNPPFRIGAAWRRN